MFFKKEIKPETVTCEECGCLVLKCNAHAILKETEIFFYPFNEQQMIYYCKRDKKCYDRLFKSSYGIIYYYKTIPKNEIKVDENGKEIKHEENKTKEKK